MTMIASTFSQEMPFLIGDLLFSSKKGKPDFITPTQIPFFPDTENTSSYKPVELWQKIYILRDNLVIALAGDYNQMKSFLSELKIRLAYYDVIDKESIKNFLRDFDMDVNFSESAMLMMLILPQDSESNFVSQYSFGNWSKEVHQHFGSVWASGSGAERFLSQFKLPTFFDTDSPQGTVEYAVIANLTLIAKWLAIEKASGMTLKDLWGGGFEMIYFNGQKFVKFQEICFVVFEGHSDEHGVTEAVFPSVIMYHYYVDDILYITSLKLINGNFSEIENNVCYYCDNIETTLFVVAPIDLPAGTTINTKSNHSFEANTISAGYSIINHNQGMFNPTYFLKEGTVSVKFIDEQSDGQSVEIKVPIEINQQILLAGKAAFEFERNNK